MKKILLILIAAFSQILALEAFEIEGRIAYFYPQNNHVRENYGKYGWAEFQIEASTPLNFLQNCSAECGDSCSECRNHSGDWNAWFNAAYYHKKGHATCFYDTTTIDNWAFNFGIRKDFCILMCFKPYLGIGAGFGYVSLRDKSFFAKQHTHKWCGTLLLKSGILYDITCNIFADLFIDYGFNWAGSQFFHCKKTSNLNTGGLKVGLGLGYRF